MLKEQNSTQMENETKSRVFDFRMDLSSWLTIIAMILLVAFMFIPLQAGMPEGAAGILKNLGLGVLITFLLTAISCIPVIIYCWFANVIPDIDYSVIVAAILSILSMGGYFLM